jgi:hypothetical protein
MPTTLRPAGGMGCLTTPLDTPCSMGEFHDHRDAKWIVIRRQLWGHNDTPCGWQGWDNRQNFEKIRPVGRLTGFSKAF